MNANYSEALEQQLACVRLLENEAWFRGVSHRGHIQNGLLHADTFYVSPPICKLIETAARSYPNAPLGQLDPPVTHGFVWLSSPVEMPPLHVGDPAPEGLMAIAWLPARFNDEDGLIVSMWTQGGIGVAAWRYGDGWRDFEPYIDGEPSQGGNVDFIRAQRRYVSALFSFLTQRILVPQHLPVERHVRKRVARSGWDHPAVVRVLELRRKERIGDKHGVNAIEHEWSCQWVVRGHWRQQPYPKVGEVRPKWITPYVKGPDDKPLKPPRATVFAVVR